MTQLKTLLLDTGVWDLVLDSSRNIALAAPPYSTAQDVTSAVKLFYGELWYDTTKGVKYLQDILAKRPPQSLVESDLENAALTVPGVDMAQLVITQNDRTTRAVSGQLQFIDDMGVANGVTF